MKVFGPQESSTSHLGSAAEKRGKEEKTDQRIYK